MAKVAISMQTYNKEQCLENTLFSIAQQDPGFEFDVCVLDDCSDINPEPLIRKYFPNAKYKRTERGPSGPDVVFGQALDQLSDDTEIVILQSADVIHSCEYTIEELVDNVQHHMFTTTYVANAIVPVNLYKDFQNGVNSILKNWEMYPPFTRAGSTRGWYFFLGVMYREDLKNLGFGKPMCDVMLQQNMWESQFAPNFLDHLKGIHCIHPTSRIMCHPIRNNLSCPIEKCNLKDHFLNKK